MAEFPEIFVLRHGQTEWNSVGRHQGRLNSPLTEKGQGQAAVQGDLLTSLLSGRDEIVAFSSPQERAVETAALALAPVGLAAKTDERLCEIAFGDWQGLTFEEIAKRWPEHCKYADQDMFAWNFKAPSGENYDDVYDRSLDFLISLDKPTVIVTHGITSYVLRGIWLGLEMHEVSALQGGQGCVYHLVNGSQSRIAVD